MQLLTPYEPYLRSLCRIMVGFTFSLHGWQKFFGWIGGQRVEDITSMLGMAGVLETFGGLLIILGLVTKPVAFILSGEMAVGYFRTHAPMGLWPIMSPGGNNGELAVFYCFFYLWLSAAGPGPWSLDKLFKLGEYSAKSEKSAPVTV